MGRGKKEGEMEGESVRERCKEARQLSVCTGSIKV